MADPKRHHFLPQFYLRGFGDERERIFQIEKVSDPKAIPTKVARAGLKRNYHTLDWTDQPADRATIEQRLSKVESEQAEMLRAVVADPAEFAPRRDDAIAFVNLMHHRVPGFKRDIEDRLAQVVNATGRMLLRQGQLPEPPESLRSTFGSMEMTFFMHRSQTGSSSIRYSTSQLRARFPPF